MKNQKIILSALVLIFLQGCATVGSKFEFQGPNSIRTGQTTRADILSQYGEPFRVGYENGDEKWTYGYYQYRVFGDFNSKDLAIIFNKNGTVLNYTYSSTDPNEGSRTRR